MQMRSISSWAALSVTIATVAVIHKASKEIIGVNVVKGAIDLHQNPQKYTFVPEPGSKGRLDAASFLGNSEQFPKGTVGYVVGLGVKAFAMEMNKITGAMPLVKTDPDFVSGNIGEHYRTQAVELLSREATEANMQALAENETGWWQSQTGLEFMVGGTVTVSERAKILVNIMDAVQAS